MSDEAQMLTAPAPQAMSDGNGSMKHAAKCFEGQSGIFVRQKLDVLEVLCPAFEKRNKYKVAGLGNKKGKFSPDDNDDKDIKKKLKSDPLFGLKEKETGDCSCLVRQICKARRPFTMKVTSSKKAYEGAPDEDSDEHDVAVFDRPFMCHWNCCCFMFQPMEISARHPDGEKYGKVEYDFRICDEMCCKKHWKIMDAEGETKYIMEENMCSINMCAPTYFCPVHTFEIFDVDKEDDPPTGFLRNYFPGCTTRGFLGTADNYRVDFPDSADYKMKYTMMAMAVLIDMQIFEKADDDQDM